MRENTMNPKGNPKIKEYGFKTDRVEPLTEKLQIRVPASMNAKVKSKNNWHEFVRQAIAKALKESEIEEPRKSA